VQATALNVRLKPRRRLLARLDADVLINCTSPDGNPRYAQSLHCRFVGQGFAKGLRKVTAAPEIRQQAALLLRRITLPEVGHEVAHII